MNEPLPETVAVRVIPLAKRDQVGGERDGRLMVRTVSPPVDGKANAAVTKLLAAYLGVPARRLELVAGHGARDKVFRIRD